MEKLQTTKGKILKLKKIKKKPTEFKFTTSKTINKNLTNHIDSTSEQSHNNSDLYDIEIEINEDEFLPIKTFGTLEELNQNSIKNNEIKDKSHYEVSGYLFRKRKDKNSLPNANQPNRCHMCRRVISTGRILTCCNPECKEGYCYGCIRKFYVCFIIYSFRKEVLFTFL